MHRQRVMATSDAAPYQPIGGAAAKRIFDRFDEDKSGAVSTEEMGRMLRSLKMDPSPEELAKLMKDADRARANLDLRTFGLCPACD